MHAEELERPKTWKIYRNGKLAAEATYHLEAKSIVKQLSKLDRNAYFVVRPLSWPLLPVLVL